MARDEVNHFRYECKALGNVPTEFCNPPRELPPVPYKECTGCTLGAVKGHCKATKGLTGSCAKAVYHVSIAPSAFFSCVGVAAAYCVFVSY